MSGAASQPLAVVAGALQDGPVAAGVPGEQLLYLYGIVPAGQPVPACGPAALQAIPIASLVALVEPVPASEFSAGALDERLQRLDWIVPLARRHEAVLEDIMRHGPVIPARLCTLFSSAGALAGSLGERTAQLDETLRWLDGRQEWGVKVYCDEARLHLLVGSSDPQALALEAAAAAASAGQAYVLRKQRDARVAEVVAARVDAILDEVWDTLGAAAVDIRLRPTLTEAATGRREAMVLSAALLVEYYAERELHAVVAELAAKLGPEGIAVELSGPWPPYAFCEDDSPTGEEG